MLVHACPACHQGYDVSALEVGARVRCACGAAFTVPAGGARRVEALVCAHCGGELGAEERTCGWCGAAVEPASRREGLLCPACHERNVEGSRYCRACGRGIAPQALTPLREGCRCPRCDGGLVHRVLEDPRGGGHEDLVTCEGCGGVWIGEETLGRLLARARSGELAATVAGASGETPWREDPAGASEEGYVRCLVCGELLFHRAFRWQGRASGVVVDPCRGHGVWLDRDELARIVAFVAEAPAWHEPEPPAAFPSGGEDGVRGGGGALAPPATGGERALTLLLEALAFLGRLLI